VGRCCSSPVDQGEELRFLSAIDLTRKTVRSTISPQGDTLCATLGPREVIGSPRGRRTNDGRWLRYPVKSTVAYVSSERYFISFAMNNSELVKHVERLSLARKQSRYSELAKKVSELEPLTRDETSELILLRDALQRMVHSRTGTGG
jgi:hypothetical protein